VTMFAGACFGIMWAATLAAVWAAEHHRRTYGVPWRWWTWGQLSAALCISALYAWVWL